MTLPHRCYFAGLPDWSLFFLVALFQRQASQLKAFENELGVQPPLGFWDPAGLSSDAWTVDIVFFLSGRRPPWSDVRVWSVVSFCPNSWTTKIHK